MTAPVTLRAGVPWAHDLRLTPAELYGVLGTMLHTLHILSCFILMRTQGGRNRYFPHLRMRKHREAEWLVPGHTTRKR